MALPFVFIRAREKNIKKMNEEEEEETETKLHVR